MYLETRADLLFSSNNCAGSYLFVCLLATESSRRKDAVAGFKIIGIEKGEGYASAVLLLPYG